MSGRRFGLLLVLLVLVLGTASFVLVARMLDDDPQRAQTADTTSTTTSSTTSVPGGLVTPTFVVVVSSEGDPATSGAMADELTERGYDSGVLSSDDHSSLEPGFWVAYVGPFADAAAAQDATDQLVADGYRAAYPRCVGTADECP